MRTRLRSMWMAVLLAVIAGSAQAADPAEFPALEWIPGEGARESIDSSEGAVFVDLFAHY